MPNPVTYEAVKRGTARGVEFRIEGVEPLFLDNARFSDGKGMREEAQKWATENGGGKIE